MNILLFIRVYFSLCLLYIKRAIKSQTIEGQATESPFCIQHEHLIKQINDFVYVYMKAFVFDNNIPQMGYRNSSQGIKCLIIIVKFIVKY